MIISRYVCYYLRYHYFYYWYTPGSRVVRCEVPVTGRNFFSGYSYEQYTYFTKKHDIQVCCFFIIIIIPESRFPSNIFGRIRPCLYQIHIARVISLISAHGWRPYHGSPHGANGSTKLRDVAISFRYVIYKVKTDILYICFQQNRYLVYENK